MDLDLKDIKFQKWEWTDVPNDKLKEIAKDIYNNKIFTSAHIRGNEIRSVFMGLMFLGGPDSDLISINENDDKVLKRRKKLYNINMMIEREKYFNKLGTTTNKAYEDWINNIGLVYEYYNQAGPMSVNGYPTFFSMCLLNKQDAKKIWEYYEKYKEIREQADNF